LIRAEERVIAIPRVFVGVTCDVVVNVADLFEIDLDVHRRTC